MAEYIRVFDDDITLMNADTELDAILARCSRISLTHPVLLLGRTPQSI